MMTPDKKKKAVHVRHILQRLLSNYQQFSHNPLLRICETWADVVGTKVAHDTKPSAYKSGVLWVHVSSAPWAHQMQFLKTDIIAKLNATLGQRAISEIKFKIGPLH